MSESEGLLFLNETGRWQFDNHELTSGDRVEIELIPKVWTPGRIEHLHTFGYHFFTRTYEWPIALKKGMRARL